MKNISIKRNLLQIRDHIHKLKKKYNRENDAIELLAVSKHQEISSILQAVNQQQLHFGESYLQEACRKIDTISMQYPCVWHFIGPIQRNKTQGIANHFDWVHSVSSILIAKRLNDQRPDSLPPLNICIQVNISHEPSKSGVEPNELIPLLTSCLSLPKIKLRGLMVIPKFINDISEQRKIFRETYNLQQNLIAQGFKLDTLSMGMSHDMEAAIAEGATILRIGRAIFGER